MHVEHLEWSLVHGKAHVSFHHHYCYYLVLSATVAEQDGLEANSMGSGDWVYSLLTSCESLARYAPPLCLSLFICNMGLIIVSTLL